MIKQSTRMTSGNIEPGWSTVGTGESLMKLPSWILTQALEGWCVDFKSGSLYNAHGIRGNPSSMYVCLTIYGTINSHGLRSGWYNESNLIVLIKKCSCLIIFGQFQMTFGCVPFSWPGPSVTQNLSRRTVFQSASWWCSTAGLSPGAENSRVPFVHPRGPRPAPLDLNLDALHIH